MSIFPNHPPPDKGDRATMSLLARHAAATGRNLNAILHDLAQWRRQERDCVRAALARDLARARKESRRRKGSDAEARRLQAINRIAGTAEEQLARATRGRAGRRQDRQAADNARQAVGMLEALLRQPPLAVALLTVLNHAAGGVR